MTLEDKLFLDRFIVDDRPHLRVISPEKCERCAKKHCIYSCPAGVYQWDEKAKKMQVAYEDCLECGTCRIVCREFNNIEWRYPRGGFGVSFKFG